MPIRLPGAIEDEIAGDFQIEAQGQIINTHKSILANASPYFGALFKWPNFKETSENRLVIKEFDYPTIRDLVEFQRTGKLCLHRGNIEAIFRCAHAYDLPRAIDQCARYIEENMSVSYLFLVSNFSPDSNLDRIYAKLLHWFGSETNVHDQFDAGQFTYDLMRDLASSQSVRRIDMHEFTVKWYEYDRAERYHQANFLFSRICYDHIGVELLKQLAEGELAEKFDGLRESLGRSTYIGRKEYYRRLASGLYKEQLNRPGFLEPFNPSLRSTDFELKFTDSDFSLIVDGKPIETHRAVLIAKSGKLQRELAGDGGETSSYTISGHEFGVVESLVKFLYINKLELDSGNIERVFCCAYYLGMSGAVGRCAEYMTINQNYHYLILISEQMPYQDIQPYFIEEIMTEAIHKKRSLIRALHNALFGYKFSVIRDEALKKGKDPFCVAVMGVFASWCEYDSLLRLLYIYALSNLRTLSDEEARLVYLSCIREHFESLRRRITEQDMIRLYR